MCQILIVDDQSFNLDAAMAILEHGVNLKNCAQSCKIAFNGKMALDMVIENCESNDNLSCNYDLILMDCNMPIMDGYEST